MMSRSILCAVVLSTATATSAAGWTQFAECGGSGHEHIYSYDPASVSDRKGKVQVRLNVDYSLDPTSRARSGRMQWSLDCNAGTYFEKSRTDYRADRKVVASYRRASETMTIVTDSVAEKLARKVCEPGSPARKG